MGHEGISSFMPRDEFEFEIQKSKGKNQNDNSKCKTFNLCSVILHFYFCILKGFGAERLWYLGFV